MGKRKARSKGKRKGGGPLTYRPCTDADLELLFRIYAKTREDEMAYAPMDDAQKEQFLRSQFQLQHADYRGRFPRADYDLILRGGEPIGRRSLDRGPDEYRLLDLALLDTGREGELWWQLLSAVIAESDAAGIPLAFQALHDDPKLPVYAGLGFDVVDTNDLRRTLRRSPAARAAEGG